MPKKGYWKSQGMQWDESETPECSYCGAEADGVDVYLYETPFNGIICCEDTACLHDFLGECSILEFYEEG
jgi:hypothetical protein